jgi:hypothetical protein
MRFRERTTESIIPWGEHSLRPEVYCSRQAEGFSHHAGVVIGSAAIVLVVTIGSTGELYIISQIEGIGANLAYATLNRSGASTALEDELTP